MNQKTREKLIKQGHNPDFMPGWVLHPEVFLKENLHMELLAEQECARR